MLINLYCTHRAPPPLELPHTLRGRRDRTDPELPGHLHGFAGYIAQAGGKMTAPLFRLIQHVRRVQHHLSVEVESAHLPALTAWATAASAILFLPDGSVRDPQLRVLLGPDGATDPDAAMPSPADALARKTRSHHELAGLGIEVVAALPPTISADEAELRDPRDVVRRALALLVVAVRAESIHIGHPWPVSEILARFPLALEALSPDERAFMDDDDPDQDELPTYTWRYEALAALLWALGRVDSLPFPDAICDVKATVQAATALEPGHWLEVARLRPTAEILDALDVTYRLQWAVRQALHIAEREVPAGLEPGVVAERHHAFNWLVRHDDADWDEVDTPT